MQSPTHEEGAATARKVAPTPAHDTLVGPSHTIRKAARSCAPNSLAVAPKAVTLRKMLQLACISEKLGTAVGSSAFRREARNWDFVREAINDSWWCTPGHESVVQNWPSLGIPG